MLKPIPLCPVDPRPADTWPGSLKDIRDRLDDHVSDRHDPHGTLDMESVKRVVGTGSASVETKGAEVTVTVPDRLSGFVNDSGYVTSGHVWKQSSVEGLSKALADMAADVAAKAPLENGTVPAGAIPDQFDEVLFYSSGMDFINDVGRPGKLYVDMSGNGIYRWSESGTFVALDGGLGRLVGNQVAALKELMKKEYAVRNHDHDERYSAKDHDHDGRYVPFEMEVLTDQWDVIPPDGHDASEYETPWIEWGDTFGSGTESWEYSPYSNTPESVSFDRDERGPLAVRLEVKGSAGGEFADGHIVRRVVTVRMFGTSGGEVVLGDNFPRASASAYGAVKIGSGLSVSDGVVSSSGQPNVIETVKVNGKPLNVVSKSVDVTVPDAYPKSETDAMLDEKADRLGGWIVDPPSVGLVWVDADHPNPNAPSGATGWWPDSQGAVKGDRDSTELHWAEGSEAPLEITAVRKAVLYTGDANPNVIETVKVDGVPLHVSDDKSVDIRSTGMISDSAGNVVRADGSAVVKGSSSWTCNGVVLMKQGEEDVWVNKENRWTLVFAGNNQWRFIVFGVGSAVNTGPLPSDATSLSFNLKGVTYNATIGRDDSVVMAATVIPMGRGTVKIASIAGKDIKAPDAPVSSVNGKKGVVKLVAQDVGALALSSRNEVGSSFSMYFPQAESSGGNLSFGIDGGPSGLTFAFNKLYCSGNSFANGFVVTNTSNTPGESVLDRIQEYGGDFKTALQEVNGLIGTAVKDTATAEYVDGMAKYPVVQKSGTTVMLEDRKVNVYSGTLTSDVTLVLPAANADGRVRDLEFRAEVSGLRLVGVRRTDASGAAVSLFSMSPESVPAEEGVNAWYFTETGGEVRVERAVLKPAGFQVKMDFTCTSSTDVTNNVDFLDSAGETVKSIKFGKQTLSEIVSGVSSLRINMSEYGHIVMNGTTYYKSSPELLSAIPLTGDSVITASVAEYCLAPDTPILTPSGPVELKDVHVGDKVIGVDADGRVCTTTVTSCDTDMEKWADSCDRWTFVRENGDTVVVTTVMRHRFYNVERGEMVYMDEWNVGEHGRGPDGRVLELVSHEHVDGPARHMTLFTGTQTYFAGGLLSGNRHTPYIDWEDR